MLTKIREMDRTMFAIHGSTIIGFLAIGAFVAYGFSLGIFASSNAFSAYILSLGVVALRLYSL